MNRLVELLAQYKETVSGVDGQQHSFFNQMAVVHHSSAIENSTLTLDETILLLEHHLTPPNRPITDVLMAKDHFEALLFVLDLARTKSELDESVIHSIGAKLMKNTGGKVSSVRGDFDTSHGDYRKVIVRAGESVFPDPIKVPDLMKELIHNMNESIKETQTITEIFNLSYDVHFQAVSIHPFGDGNGRFSRLLMNYVQAYHHLPMIYIFDEDKPRYFKALVHTRERGDIGVFREFMLWATAKCLAHQMEYYKNLKFKLIKKDRNSDRFINLIF